MLATDTPFRQFYDLQGRPLTGGRIYYGVAGQNPVTNPITVYWDAEGTQPADQPVRTSLGFSIRAGTPSVVYVGQDYSMLVQDASGQQVFFARNSQDFSLAAQFTQLLSDLSSTSNGKGADLVGGVGRVVNNIDGLRGLLKTGTGRAWVLGYYAVGDGGGGQYYLDPSDNITDDDGGTVIVADDGGRWKLQHNGTISVCQFGAYRDGSAISTTRIQAAADALASWQTAQITAKRMVNATLHFPDGNFRTNAAIKIRGFINLLGVGTAYTAGSVLHQETANTNIFEFYGSINDRTSLGVCVQGFNFEFDSSLSSSSAGYALSFPYQDDVSGNILSSNSHYIRFNRCGGWHAKGRFLYMAQNNDVELSGNTVDVCADGPAIVMGSQAYTGASDVRIVSNNFYYCKTAIQIHSCRCATITGNTFGTGFNGSGWAAIKLVTDNGTITAGKISGVSITGNTFRNNYNLVVFDGSASFTFGSNSATGCYNAPIRGASGPSYKGVKVHGNHFVLDSTYPLTFAPFQFADGQLQDSDIHDNSVDCNGLTAVNSFCNDNNTSSWVAGNTTWRDNYLLNNGVTDAGLRTAALMPLKARGLSMQNRVTSSVYPAGLALFTFGTLSVGDSVSFDLDWEVTVDQTGVNSASRRGRTRVTVMRRSATKSDVTLISSVADDTSGAGGGVLPTVTWAVTTATAPSVTCAVTSSLTPSNVYVRAKASGFDAEGSPSMRCIF